MLTARHYINVINAQDIFIRLFVRKFIKLIWWLWKRSPQLQGLPQYDWLRFLRDNDHSHEVIQSRSRLPTLQLGTGESIRLFSNWSALIQLYNHVNYRIRKCLYTMDDTIGELHWMLWRVVELTKSKIYLIRMFIPTSTATGFWRPKICSQQLCLTYIYDTTICISDQILLHALWREILRRARCMIDGFTDYNVDYTVVLI